MNTNDIIRGLSSLLIKDFLKGFALTLLMVTLGIAVVFFASKAFAENPHHPIPSPVVNITEVTRIIELPDVTINNYIQDEVRLNDLEKHINALSALSSIPSLSSGTTGLGVGFGNSSGALALEHRNGVMSYRLGVGHSQGVEVYNLGIMGSFR